MLLNTRAQCVGKNVATTLLNVHHVPAGHMLCCGLDLSQWEDESLCFYCPSCARTDGTFDFQLGLNRYVSIYNKLINDHSFFYM